MAISNGNQRVGDAKIYLPRGFLECQFDDRGGIAGELQSLLRRRPQRIDQIAPFGDVNILGKCCAADIFAAYPICDAAGVVFPRSAAKALIRFV
jgi:hypothetical protein